MISSTARLRPWPAQGRSSRFLTIVMGALLVASALVVAPTATAPAAAYDCREVIMVGVRGSGETEGDNGGLGATVERTRQTLAESLSGKRSLSIEHLNYAATSTDVILPPPWGKSLTNVITQSGTMQFLEGAWAGGDSLLAKIKDIANSCNSWIVLAGYSQGAMVIRHALVSGLPPAALNKIAGIALLSDPERHGSGDGLDHYGGAPQSSNGVYEAVIGVRQTPAPRGRGLAASWCLKGDPICDYSARNLLSAGNHFKYKNNGMARLAGYWMAEDLLKLPARPVTTPAANVPPRPAPPAGNYVSTCNLAGADHCTGVNLRSRPIWPGNVTGSLPELTGVSVVCAAQGSWIRDANGRTSNWWGWLRASGGREGYVNYLYINGPSVTPPHCGPYVDSAAPAEMSGSFRQFATVSFKYPIRNDSPLRLGLSNIRVAVNLPDGQRADAACSGGSSVSLEPGQAWTCNAEILLTQRGAHNAALGWNWTADNGYSDGTPHWTQPWRFDFAAHAPVDGVSTQLDGAGTFVGSSSTITSVIRNGTNRSLTLPELTHKVRNPAGAVSSLPCATDVVLPAGATYECRSQVDFPTTGDYRAWFDYRLPGGAWNPGAKLFEPDWTFTILRPIVTPELELSGFSVNTPAITESPLEVEYAIRNTGTVRAHFYPTVLSEPIIYGGFGHCEGINYSPSGQQEWVDFAVALDPGEVFRCVARDVIPESALGTHELVAGALMVSANGDPVGEVMRTYPLTDITVTQRPAGDAFQEPLGTPAAQAPEEAASLIPLSESPPAIPEPTQIPAPPATPGPAQGISPEPVAGAPSAAPSAPSQLAPRVTGKAVSAGGKLRVDVDPDKGKGYWRVRVQVKSKAGQWKAKGKWYRTKGSKETRTINLPKGTYRVIVAPKYGLAAGLSNEVTLRR